jgi:uncharacterized protein (TIGR02246 family)
MREKTLLLVAAVAALISLPGCGEDSAKVRAAIEARNKDMSAAFAKGDAAAVAGFYTSNGQLLPPNAAIVSGRDSIQKAWQGFVEAGFSGLDLTTSEVEACGDHADEAGTYRLLGKDGLVADTGKYIVIWKKENGQWLLHRDIWNSNNPPAPPPVAADAIPVPGAAAPEAGAAPAAPAAPEAPTPATSPAPTAATPPPATSPTEPTPPKP